MAQSQALGRASSSHQNDSPVAESWCITQSKEEKFSYVWSINDFTSHGADTNKELKSSTFSTADSIKKKCCLSLFPGGKGEENKGYLSLYLALVSSNNTDVSTKFKFSIMNAKHQKSNTKDAGSVKLNFSTYKDWGFMTFISRESLLDPANGLLPEGKLTILCEGCVVTDTVNISGQGNYTSESVSFKVPECQLSSNLGTMFNNDSFSDVILAVKGREIRAHKVILSAQSPVFAAMFNHDMEEKRQNRVNITDVDHETLCEMLRFIYSGRAPNVDKIAGHLLAAADKYALERLKAMCEKALFKNLAIETAADTLVVADRHSAKLLKAQTITYINKSRIKAVMRTAGWKRMVSTHPRLMEDVLGALASQQQPTQSSEPPAKRTRSTVGAGT